MGCISQYGIKIISSTVLSEIILLLGNVTFAYCCAVFTSNALDITICISTRKTELFVFLVLMLMLMSSALLVKTAQDK